MSLITDCKNITLDLKTVDKDLIEVVKLWNQLSFTRTLYSCAGHPYKKRFNEPYIRFEINRMSELSGEFMNELTDICLTTAKHIKVPFIVKHVRSFAWPGFDAKTDQAFQLDYPLRDLKKLKNPTRTEMKKLREVFWPRIEKMLKVFIQKETALKAEQFNSHKHILCELNNGNTEKASARCN